MLAGFPNHVIEGHLHAEHSESNLRPVVSSVLCASGVVRQGVHFATGKWVYYCHGKFTRNTPGGVEENVRRTVGYETESGRSFN